MYLHTISAYVDYLVDALDPMSIQLLRGMKIDELSMFHHSWGQSIRNEFGLWQPDHPLTKSWHSNPDGRDIRDNTDYSQDHPDSVSMMIMQGVWKKANA